MSESRDERALELLEAVRDVLNNLDNTSYVSSFFEEVTDKNGGCDGLCLYEDIKDFLDEQ